MKREKKVPRRVRWGERSAKKAEKRWRRKALGGNAAQGFKVTPRRCRCGFSPTISTVS
jgi:hypothetical protein